MSPDAYPDAKMISDPDYPDKITDWNEYTVIAAGKRVIHQVNGVTTIDVTDESPLNRAKGSLGLQVHAGDAYAQMKITVREIAIQPLGQ